MRLGLGQAELHSRENSEVESVSYSIRLPVRRAGVTKVSSSGNCKTLNSASKTGTLRDEAVCSWGRDWGRWEMLLGIQRYHSLCLMNLLSSSLAFNEAPCKLPPWGFSGAFLPHWELKFSLVTWSQVIGCKKFIWITFQFERWMLYYCSTRREIVEITPTDYSEKALKCLFLWCFGRWTVSVKWFTVCLCLLVPIIIHQPNDLGDTWPGHWI